VQTAYLALGANIGDRLAALSGARKALDENPCVKVEGASALYETEPIGGPVGQGLYLNAVLRVTTAFAPRRLLNLCLDVEKRFGRRRDERWGERTLDIDLLLHGSVVLRQPDLIIPHPRLHERLFVLMPLLELEPELTHPLTGAALGELAAALPREGVVRTPLQW
jgi:2-amino-4-hydroxy-6-hydroxymethyldihydropteridine diphosphokinase